MQNEENNWEQYSNNYSSLCRIKVDGGWIYENGGESLVFVPDIDLNRYQAHLRDAYRKGYEDGQADGKRGINEF